MPDSQYLSLLSNVIGTTVGEFTIGYRVCVELRAPQEAPSYVDEYGRMDYSLARRKTIQALQRFTLVLEGNFDFITPEKTYHLDAGDLTSVSAVFSVFGKLVEGIHLDDVGKLELSIEGGYVFRVEPQDAYEAWQFTADNDLMIVCVPSGGLSVWAGKPE